jgi:homocysteine S-methyltransferase
VLDAEYVANEMPGARVPDRMLERMRRARTPEAARAEGIAVAKEIYQALKSRVQGVNVSSPAGQVGLAFEILS